MLNDPKGDHAKALIAALQTILDRLPDQSDADETIADGLQEEIDPVADPTHELFVDRLNQDSLAGLFTSIRIIHNIHNTAKHGEAVASA